MDNHEQCLFLFPIFISPFNFICHRPLTCLLYTSITALNDKKDAKRTPFSPTWEVLRKIDDHLILLCKKGNRRNSYATLYLHTFTFRIPRTLSKTEKFNQKYPNSQKIENIGDRLRYYRYQKALFQRDIAQFLGIDRTTYNSYEMGVRECPLELSLIHI